MLNNFKYKIKYYFHNKKAFTYYFISIQNP